MLLSAIRVENSTRQIQIETIDDSRDIRWADTNLSPGGGILRRTEQDKDFFRASTRGASGICLLQTVILAQCNCCLQLCVLTSQLTGWSNYPGF